MPAGRGEDDNVGLKDIGLIEDNIDRRDEDDAATLLDVMSEVVLELEQGYLMSRERSRHDHHLAVIELVTASVIRPALQVAKRHLARDRKHSRHRSIVLPRNNASGMPFERLA